MAIFPAIVHRYLPDVKISETFVVWLVPLTLYNLRPVKKRWNIHTLFKLVDFKVKTSAEWRENDFFGLVYEGRTECMCGLRQRCETTRACVAESGVLALPSFAWASISLKFQILQIFFDDTLCTQSRNVKKITKSFIDIGRHGKGCLWVLVLFPKRLFSASLVSYKQNVCFFCNSAVPGQNFLAL